MMGENETREHMKFIQNKNPNRITMNNVLFSFSFMPARKSFKFQFTKLLHPPITFNLEAEGVGEKINFKFILHVKFFH